MKNLFTIFLIVVFSTTLFGQKSISYKNWSSPVTFETSTTPVITGYGEYSDSLSEVYDGKTFYANGNDYFQIESWADYYYWFTQKYWYKFKNPELYEYFYLTENDYEMARYIATQYQGKYYPAPLAIELEGKDDESTINRTKKKINYANNTEKTKELKKDLKDPVNEVKVRAFSYDINKKKAQPASRRISNKRFDYSQPNKSGVRTFHNRTSPTKVRPTEHRKTRSTKSKSRRKSKSSKSGSSKTRER